MSEFELSALQTLTDLLYVLVIIIVLGYYAGIPLYALSIPIGAFFGLFIVAGRFRVIPGTPIEVVRR